MAYTRCCKVKMSSGRAIQKILRVSSHVIHGRRADVFRFLGTRAQAHLFVRGLYKISIQVEVFVKTSKGQMLYEKLDDKCLSVGNYSRMVLETDDYYLYTGVAFVRFDNKNDKKAVLDLNNTLIEDGGLTL